MTVKGDDLPAISTQDATERALEKPLPKVTQATIQDHIAEIEYIYPAMLTTMTICIIRMVNGFIVLGKSAPVSEGNFDRDIGKRFAYDDAFKQLWQLEGYLLKQRIYEDGQAQAAAIAQGGQFKAS